MVADHCRSRRAWLLWGGFTLLLAALLAAGLSFRATHEGDLQTQLRALFSPSPLSAGHAQIALQCPACHGANAASGPGVIQDACTHCHARDEFNKAADLHRISLFEGPANAARITVLDASRCATCHSEHRPAAQHTAGYSLPADFCIACHREVAKDRPSHAGLRFDSCLNSGCHNYHDNRALTESFLVKHALRPQPELRSLRPEPNATIATEAALTRNPHRDTIWQQQACEICHRDERATFVQGKHGMRVAAGLGPMSPRLSSLPFTKASFTRTLSCTTCHAALNPDVRRAAVEACVGCHNDPHTLAYQGSRHELAWRKELRGEAPRGSGVSCASCHLPTVEAADGSHPFSTHNPNAFLRPNSRQLRIVCLSCHTLPFSIDALADRQLIERNFRGLPTRHIPSIEMAVAHKRSVDDASPQEH